MLVSAGVLGLFLIAMWVWCVVTAFKSDGVVWGVVNIVFCGLGTLVWILAKCENEKQKGLFLGGFLATIVSSVVDLILKTR